MLHSRKLKNLINDTHQITLSIVCRDYLNLLDNLFVTYEITNFKSINLTYKISPLKLSKESSICNLKLRIFDTHEYLITLLAYKAAKNQIHKH